MNNKLIEYLNSFKAGERVVETAGCMVGHQGTTYIKEDGTICVHWELDNGNSMGTSITGGTRRLHEKDLVWD